MDPHTYKGTDTHREIRTKAEKITHRGDILYSALVSP